MRNELHETFSYGVIYIYSIPDEGHRNRLKIGSATVNTMHPTPREIEAAAHARIKQQTKTADVRYVLEYFKLAVTNEGEFFSDYDVHNVLIRSGYDRKSENTKNIHSEWFEIDLVTAKNAILAVEEGREALTTSERTRKKHSTFQFRPNQLDAIAQTTKAIRQNRKHYLWNAKMRFGKTSAAMRVALDNNLNKVLIVTHRPSVSTDWYNDFLTVFSGTGYEYSSRTKGESLERRLSDGKPFVYFASLQDLRLSEIVVSDKAAKSQAKGFKKNLEVFDTDWDMLIIDEAHEGTQSNLGDTTLSKIKSGFTLQLSGTPFNILHKREESEIYTWDYVMEQDEKLHWDERNPGVPNPYAELPSLAMFTYDIDKFADHLGELGAEFHDSLDGAFRFHEFFRVLKDDDGNDTAEFVHEQMVNKFLDLLVDGELSTKFPYSSEEYRTYNKHSLWLLPNRVKAIEAMERLLNDHPVFGNFGIVNISGNAKDDDESDTDAKDKVVRAIAGNDYTITLTGQRLTTGASVPEWTAVFMLSDTSSATTYLQTAFRCQTPARIDGQLKTQGYVFDFAPDRTLKLVAEAIELNHRSGKINTPEQTAAMGEFLNFCPILAAESGTMKPFSVGTMLEQLKKAIIDRVSRNGFDDPKLYNDELMKLGELELTKFNELRAIVGASTKERINDIEVNAIGMTDFELAKAEQAERNKKQKKELTDEEKAVLEARKEALDQRKTAISILRGVSIRMPMLVYGAKVSPDEGISLEKFIELVDDESWAEFMPQGLTKDGFREFIKYYDEEVFRGVTRSIRLRAFDCDKLLPFERVQAIAELFGSFKNPDKETVLTPWTVVNTHFKFTLGGSDFENVNQRSSAPEWKNNGEITQAWSNENTKVLEINSKSGLYPLLAAFDIYSRELKKQKQPEEKISKSLWGKILRENIFTLCKSPMARTITIRTLAGYSGAKVNAAYIENLIEKLREQYERKGYNLNKELQKEFKGEGKEVKFTAVVGNPPYQINTDTNFSTPVYHLFVEAAKRLDPDYVTLIHPARFLFDAGATPKEWNKQMLNDPHLSVPLYEPDSQKIFSGVDIKGGVCVTLWEKSRTDGGLGGEFMPYEELRAIRDKDGVGGFDKIVGPRGGTRAKRWLDTYKRYRSYLPSSVFTNNQELFTQAADSSHTVQITGLINNKRTERYISADLLDDNDLNKWKLFIPKSIGSGALGEALSTPILGGPLVGCTESFLQVGPFENEAEAQNCIKYLRTKFCRALLGTKKITQDNSRNVWKNVPLQDFTVGSDIDWSKPIVDVDKQLYQKYDLDEKEVTFIESRVKAME